MANKKPMVKLSSEVRILLKADQSEAGEGWSDERICEALDTNISMVTRVRAKLVQEGLDAMLTRKDRRRRSRRSSMAPPKHS